MTQIPAVYPALVARWKLAAASMDLAQSQILDGPAVTYAGTEGVAVGATADDTTAEFDFPPGALDGDAERTVIPCLAWAGWGDTTFGTLRDRVNLILTTIRADLAADRTIGGTVSTAWITGGNFRQDHVVETVDGTPQYFGALVMCEFRIQFDRF